MSNTNQSKEEGSFSGGVASKAEALEALNLLLNSAHWPAHPGKVAVLRDFISGAPANAGEPSADESKLWRARYYELRHTMQDWHAQALTAGFDGVSEVLLVAAEAAKLFSALNAMLTYFGMDEDEWSRPTFKQAKEAIAQYNAARSALSSQSASPTCGAPEECPMCLPHEKCTPSSSQSEAR